MNEYLLDSDVLIWQLRRRPETVALLNELSRTGFIACSAISVVEIQAGVRPGEEEKTDTFLTSLRVYNLDFEIASLAGRYLRDYKSKGITLDFADAVIAATAVTHELTLVTYNVRHYPMPAVRLYPAQ